MSNDTNSVLNGTASKAEPDAWQKRGPSTNDRWTDCSKADAIYWANVDGYETRALFASPVVASGQVRDALQKCHDALELFAGDAFNTPPWKTLTDAFAAAQDALADTAPTAAGEDACDHNWIPDQDVPGASYCHRCDCTRRFPTERTPQRGGESAERIAQRLEYMAGQIEQGERGDNAKLRQMAQQLLALSASAARSDDGLREAIQHAIDNVQVPKISATKAEYWKAGARATISAVSAAIALQPAARQGGEG